MNAEDTRDSGCGERLLEDLLAQAHSATPMDLPVLVNRCAEAFGLGEIDIYLTDLQQRRLVGLTDGLATLDIDASVAGWCYRTVSLRIEDVETGFLCLWLPVVDGAERLGVLGVRTRSVDAVRLRRCRMLTGIVAMAITSKRAYSDSFARRARAERMQLPAEMLRAFLPPRTIGNAHVVSTAVLEPAYEIGGDAFDHSLTQSTLHAAILDAMGHDLASGLTTSVALAGCRNARRAGAGLLDLVETIDQALAQWLPDKYCTGILTQLDLATGLFSWSNCGHPPPVLIRGGRVVAGALERTPSLPWASRPGSATTRVPSTNWPWSRETASCCTPTASRRPAPPAAVSSAWTASRTPSFWPPPRANWPRSRCVVSSTPSSTPRTATCSTTPPCSSSNGGHPRAGQDRQDR